MTIFPHIAHYRILKPSEPHFRGSFLFLYGGLWSGYDSLLVDVVDHATKSVATELSAAIENLPHDEKMRILKVVSALIEK